MAKKKNRPFRSGSTQHYEEKLLKPFVYKQTQEDNVLTDLEISWFFLEPVSTLVKNKPIH
jgi:hypothetical protein